MGLNMKALEKAQEDLKKRSGSKNWIQASKLEKALDFRIQDPTPSMNGIYYVEVPTHWINGTRVISPRIFGPQEKDVIISAVNEAKAANDPDLTKLLNAVGENKLPKIQLNKTEFWIPILKFNWETDSQGNITGITNKDGVIDPEMIKKFIEDGKWKILVVGISTLKAINEIATKRGGLLMTDPVKGFNLILTKSGEKRDTKYAVTKDEVYPMPAELYKPEAVIDPFELAQAQMFTDEYMDAIIGKYLYGEDCPEKTDACYAYPDLREKFKALNEDTEGEEAPAARPRPGRAAAAAAPVEEAPKAPETTAPAPATTGRTRPGTAPAAAATRTRGAAAPEAAKTTRRGRNLADDLASV